MLQNERAVVRKSYPLTLEVEANFACFANPFAGYQAESFLFPPRSAAEGLFANIAVVKGAVVRVLTCRICFEPRTTVFKGTYLGPMRKNNQKAEGTPQLLYSTMLIRPRYQFDAVVENIDVPKEHVSLGMDQFRQRAGTGSRAAKRGCGPGYGRFNSAHAYQEIFNRRLAKGQCFRTPYLGQREYSLTYFGPFREETKVNEGLTFTVPLMVDCIPSSPFIKPHEKFRYIADFEVVKGVVNYDQGK